MRSPRFIRAFAVVGMSALVLGAFAAVPAEAKKKKKKAFTCAAFTPGIEAAAEAPVVRVTEAATEAAPIVVESAHPESLVQEHSALPDTQDEQYVNIQVVSKASQGLYIKEEFNSRHDIDLHLYNSAGEEVDSSGAFNPLPVDATYIDFTSNGRGGENYESIVGFPADSCGGYTAESVGYATSGTPIKFSIWLGDAVAPEE